jgi:hypothetical protein
MDAKEERAPWQIPVGITVLAASLVPVWMLNLDDAPDESKIRFWTTLVVAVALWGTARKIALFRWLLLALLGTGIAVSVWPFASASTMEVRSTLISLAQALGMGLFFTPGANAWFRKPTERPLDGGAP